MNNPYSDEVEEWDILSEEVSKPFGQRLTKFKCTKCNTPLSEADLFDVRIAHAPCQHYSCCFPKG